MTNPTINVALQAASESLTTDFQSWPKIPRLSKESMIITEKIDGTNAQVLIMESGEIKTGSRNRWVTPEDDNYGFAKWVAENELDIRKLGPGRHFGEWWGQGIQRGYGLDHKRFSLFNTRRPADSVPGCVGVVPVLYQGQFDSPSISTLSHYLMVQGSHAAPGFMKPEGLVVHFPHSKLRFKVLFENDDMHKGEVVV